jgi:hypothetical protein
MNPRRFVATLEFARVERLQITGLAASAVANVVVSLYS